jgi:hypothetical protein
VSYPPSEFGHPQSARPIQDANLQLARLQALLQLKRAANLLLERVTQLRDPLLFWQKHAPIGVPLCLGWTSPKMDMNELNRQQQLRNFPPDRRWRSVMGVMIQPRSDVSRPPLVSIAGIDQAGREVAFWTDLPNAMYLMNMLSNLRPEHFSSVPSNPPPECQEYDGNP